MVKKKTAEQQMFYETEFGAKYASTQKGVILNLAQRANTFVKSTPVGWKKAVLRIAFSNVKYHINIKYSVQRFDSVIKAMFPNF